MKVVCLNFYDVGVLGAKLKPSEVDEVHVSLKLPPGLRRIRVGVYG